MNVISGIGMITPVGWDAETACASFRAGITRPRELKQFLMDDDYQATPLVGHQVYPLTEGFTSIGLWIRLLNKCLEDLFASSSIPRKNDTAFWDTTGVILCLPYLHDERYGWFEESDISKTDEFIFDLLNIPKTTIQDVIASGHASAARAVKSSIEYIHEGTVSRVIVLAVDSYLDSFTIDWLMDAGRLKQFDNPVGLIPGEAAAAFVVESSIEAEKRNSSIYGIISDVSIQKETNNYYSGEEHQKGLFNAIDMLLEESNADGILPCQFYMDLNGENWRGKEWAQTIISLNGKYEISDCLEIFPAEGFGETGAASGAISICLSLMDFKNNFSKYDHSIICSSTEHGDVSALLINKLTK